MLNKTNNKQAKLKYTHADFQIIVPGDYVICAITNKQIPIDELKYWNFERQEPYLNAKAALIAKLNN